MSLNYQKANGQVINKFPSMQAENQINSTASDVATLVYDFNSLLVKLRNAGILNDLTTV